MTNFKQLINEATDSLSNYYVKDEPNSNQRLFLGVAHMRGAELPSELLLLALEALEFECGNRCAIGLNPCNARDTIEQIRTRLEGVK